MQPIREALERLNGSINTLDAKVDDVEEILKGQQRDMFVAPSNENKKAEVTQRIDKAINTVEKLLEQA